MQLPVPAGNDSLRSKAYTFHENPPFCRPCGWWMGGFCVYDFEERCRPASSKPFRTAFGQSLTDHESDREGACGLWNTETARWQTAAHIRTLFP